VSYDATGMITPEAIASIACPVCKVPAGTACVVKKDDSTEWDTHCRRIGDYRDGGRRAMEEAIREQRAAEVVKLLDPAVWAIFCAGIETDDQLNKIGQLRVAYLQLEHERNRLLSEVQFLKEETRGLRAVISTFRPNADRGDDIGPTEEEISALRTGRKIDAIKLVRERFHLGLIEARALVEKWATERPWEKKL
jgi:hypothetical protein